jgi:outer membrane protein OmpA-like peptidoglycan-associated protein
MKKWFVILLMVAAVSSGCVATRKFTRNEVKASADQLNARIDTNATEIKETQDAVDQVGQRVTDVDQKVAGVDTRVTTVDGRVAALDTKTTEGMNSLKSNVSAVDAKTDKTMNQLGSLDEQFQNRNNLTVAAEHTIPFKFDSAALDATNTAALDEVAKALTENRDAIVVLEGRTDSTGDSEYNIRLGERRVDTVRRYLAEKNVPVYKIHQISFGSARPLAPNDSREGREKNRSVGITVLVPSMAQAAASAQ